MPWRNYTTPVDRREILNLPLNASVIFMACRATRQKREFGFNITPEFVREIDDVPQDLDALAVMRPSFAQSN